MSTLVQSDARLLFGARGHLAQHAELLGSFERDLETLRGMELHAGLRAPERRTLLDCVPVAKLRAWFTSCEKSHASFATKVAELDAIFNNLKVNVEELFMTGPDVDVAQVRRRLPRSSPAAVWSPLNDSGCPAVARSTGRDEPPALERAGRVKARQGADAFAAVVLSGEH